MLSKTLKTLDARNCEQWRKWLAKHHDSESAVWLVFHKRQTAWNYFESLAPSYRRVYIAWIDSAKQQETKTRRLREAIGLLAAGKTLGLK